MTVVIHQGDCREVLRSLPDESVHCVVTSPPYWGLRDYGTAKWEGGDAECDHRKPANGSDPTEGSTLGGGKKTTGHSQESWGASCRKCGAKRIDSQLGLEQTPDQYVQGMVDVFREVRRVLRKDGTLWLNLGDSYSAGANNTASHKEGSKQVTSGSTQFDYRRKPPAGLKPKDLVGIPWRVAFALQADGWWLRQDIIWSKPNPMPESVRDRCTKAHEYLFLLTKSERYYFDADAIAEASTGDSWRFTSYQADGIGREPSGNQKPENYDIPGKPTRNKRSVWTVTTAPFSEAHFATFPPALIEPCVLAGCPDGGTVLDPFGGAGTTGLVADRHHRNAILIELNPEYADMAKRRIEGDSPLFAQVTA